MRVEISTFLLLLLLVIVPEVTSYSTTSAGSLYTALTYGYNNLVRPSGTTSVTVGFGLLSINYLDVKNQKFSVTGWFDVTWTDGRFSWSPGSYSSINEVYLSYSTCWNPRIIVDNAVEGVSILDDSALLFRVSSSGSITWSPPGEFTVYCSMDTTYYPFDVQSCYLSVKSWSFDSSSVALSFVSNDITISQYTENDDWEITSTTLASDDVTQNSLTYSNLRFKFKLKRRSTTVLLTLLMPVILVSFLGTCSFLVPPDCESKLGVPVGVLLAEAVLLNAVLEETPTSARTVPLLGVYLMTIVVLSIMEILLTIIVLKLYNNKHSHKPVSLSAERAVAILSMMTCFRFEHSVSGTGSSLESDSIETPPVVEDPPEFKTNLKRNPSVKSVSPTCSFAITQSEEFSKARKRSRAWDDGGLCDRKFTWEDVACVIDRFCFRVFLLLRLVITAAVMLILAFGAS